MNTTNGRLQSVTSLSYDPTWTEDMDKLESTAAATRKSMEQTQTNLDVNNVGSTLTAEEKDRIDARMSSEEMHIFSF